MLNNSFDGKQEQKSADPIIVSENQEKEKKKGGLVRMRTVIFTRI